MQFYQSHKVTAIILAFTLVLILFVAVEFLFIKFNGQNVPVPNIPREKQTIGSGKNINYVVLGDSTAVGQGGEYSKGIATKTAEFLAKDRQVNLQNFAVSGARTSDVLAKQVDEAAKLNPDIALISIGANDVTHLTSIQSVESDMKKIIKKLRIVNPALKIVITGSPQMGAVPRFPQPVRYIAKLRVSTINKMFIKLASEEKVTFAPLAEKTGPIFAKNPRLFAKDKFHPNNEGYAVWVPVLTDALK